MSLAGDNSDAVDQRDYLDGTLFLELDFRVEHLQSLDTRLATIVEHQVLGVPSFLLGQVTNESRVLD